MASKTIAWADQSGDVITMTAPAWSGSQTVTLSTPENFGIARELNIVFYSESNPAVSATLNVKQAEATLALSETSLVFARDDTSEKTVTVTTNMSTLDGAQLTLEGDTASDFTLSELSALSNGQATFTIKPNSANSSQDPRNVTIKLTAGRLATLSLPVTQDADAIQSVTYSDLKVGTLNLPLINDSGYEVLPSGGSLSVYFTNTEDIPAIYRVKKTTYSSGKVVEENEAYTGLAYIACGFVYRLSIVNNIYYKAVKWMDYCLVLSLQVADGQGSVTGEIPSAGTFLATSQDSVSFCLLASESADAADLYLSTFIGQHESFPDGVYFDGGANYTVSENKRERYDNFGILTALPVTCSKEQESLGYGSAQVHGTCHYSSGATQTENVPLSFSVSMGGQYFQIIAQTPGQPGTASSKSTFTVETLSDNTGATQRTGRVDVVAEGGEIVGYVTLNQKAQEWGSLSLRNSAFFATPISIGLTIGSTSGSPSMTAGEWTFAPAKNTVTITGDAVLRYWKSEIESSGSDSVKLQWGTGTTTYSGTITAYQKSNIMNGVAVTLDLY